MRTIYDGGQWTFLQRLPPAENREERVSKFAKNYSQLNSESHSRYFYEPFSNNSDLLEQRYGYERDE
jgi:hypothetical protein